jgi:hypothetical protein
VGRVDSKTIVYIKSFDTSSTRQIITRRYDNRLDTALQQQHAFRGVNVKRPLCASGTTAAEDKVLNSDGEMHSSISFDDVD